MSVLRLVAADQLPRGPLLALFNACYAGYEVPIRIDEAGFELMIRLCDLELSRSVVGLHDEQPAAMGLLGLRGATAWIGGMGVTAAARGHGYGAEIMRALIDNARAAGVRTVDLEVLVNNAPAIRIYEELGFRKRRGLVVWLAAPSSYEPLVDSTGIMPLDVGTALDEIEHWQRGPFPWQRAPDTLANLPEPPTALGLMRDGGLVGAIVYRAVAERASVLALAARAANAQVVFDSLLGALRARHPAAVIRMLNMQDDDPAAQAFERLGARVEARQVEMRLTL